MNESVHLQLDAALGHDATDKRIDVLRRIGSAGSISEAARGAGISYKAAWQAIETLGNLAGMPLVEKAVGGSGGGGAQLTDAGRHVLRAFDLLAAARQEVISQLSAQSGANVPALSLAALGLRTSMRNQLPCVVAAVSKSGAPVQIKLELPDKTRLVSHITQESAQLLGLCKGKPVLALCKATAVAVHGGEPQRSSTNQLKGRVLRARESSGSAEITLEVAGGLKMVGFHVDAKPLAAGDTAVVQVDESAIVIALAD